MHHLCDGEALAGFTQQPHARSITWLMHMQIANAFKTARRQWHPDRHRHETLEQQAYAEEMFKLLSVHAPK